MESGKKPTPSRETSLFTPRREAFFQVNVEVVGQFEEPNNISLHEKRHLHSPTSLTAQLIRPVVPAWEFPQRSGSQ